MLTIWGFRVGVREMATSILKVAITAALGLAFLSQAPSAFAQDNAARSPNPVVTINPNRDVSVVSKDVRDIIGFGGRINVKDSNAKVLGGAAGDVKTDNASFETVILAAGTVDMKGGTVGELKIAAGKVELGITLSGDGDIAAGQVTLNETMGVAGDMDILAGSADVKGSYGGDLTIDAESVKIAGTIGGDLRINSRRINIEPGTTIGGDLVAPNLNSLRDGVIVGGDKKINKRQRGRDDAPAVRIIVDTDRAKAEVDAAAAKGDEVAAKMDEANAKIDEAKAKLDAALKNIGTDSELTDADKKAKIITLDDHDFDSDETGLISPQPIGMQAWLTVLVTLAACGALALGIAPQFLVRATERLAKEPLPSFGVGALSLVAVPAALIAVGITIIGIPFAILGAAAYMIGIGLGLIALCLWGGLVVRTLANQPGQETRLPKLVGWTLMGFLALALIGAVPMVGRVIQILAIVTGAGAVLSTAWALRKANKAEHPQQTATV